MARRKKKAATRRRRRRVQMPTFDEVDTDDDNAINRVEYERARAAHGNKDAPGKELVEQMAAAVASQQRFDSLMQAMVENQKPVWQVEAEQQIEKEVDDDADKGKQEGIQNAKEAAGDADMLQVGAEVATIAGVVGDAGAAAGLGVGITGAAVAGGAGVGVAVGGAAGNVVDQEFKAKTGVGIGAGAGTGVTQDVADLSSSQRLGGGRNRTSGGLGAGSGAAERAKLKEKRRLTKNAADNVSRIGSAIGQAGKEEARLAKKKRAEEKRRSAADNLRGIGSRIGHIDWDELNDPRKTRPIPAWQGPRQSGSKLVSTGRQGLPAGFGRIDADDLRRLKAQQANLQKKRKGGTLSGSGLAKSGGGGGAAGAEKAQSGGRGGLAGAAGPPRRAGGPGGL